MCLQPGSIEQIGQESTGAWDKTQLPLLLGMVLTLPEDWATSRGLWTPTLGEAGWGRLAGVVDNGLPNCQGLSGIELLSRALVCARSPGGAGWGTGQPRLLSREMTDSKVLGAGEAGSRLRQPQAGLLATTRKHPSLQP